jgi:hypothetical protein
MLAVANVQYRAGMSRRVAGICGICSFCLLVAGGLVQPLWDIPSSTASEQAIVAYVGQHRSAFLAALFLYATGVTLWLVPVSSIRGWLTARSPTTGALFGTAATAFTTMVLVGFVPMLVLAYRAPAAPGGGALYDLSFGALALSGLPTALALGTYASAVRRGDWLARTTAVAAIVAAVAHVAIAAGFFFRTGFLSLEGVGIVFIPATLFLWLLLASLEELRTRPTGPPGQLL